ncbi:acyltransferase [Akkermansiaceae bacterium]|nr:acyltransferase [Akkermansiaceae bacterium]
MEASHQISSQRERLHCLDSLRGIACLIVLVGHTIGTFAWDSSIYRLFLINNLIDGRSAVTFFFVLSGFVLTFSSFGKGARPLLIVPFFMRRVTRIWIPWFFFFLVSWLTKEFIPLPPQDSLSQSQLVFWSADGTMMDFLKQCLFLLKDNSKALIPQDWSLRVEMRAAVIIPVMILLTRKSRYLLAIFSVILLVLIPRTGHYYLSFVVGVYIGYLYSTKSPKGRWPVCFLILGYILYQAQWAGAQITADIPLFVSKDMIWVLSSIGCGLLMLGVLTHHRVRDIMEAKFLGYLGRISFSLYLVHLIVLLRFAPWIMNQVKLWGIEEVFLQQAIVVTGVCLISFVLADLGERFVERPCIALGRITTRLIKKRPFLSGIKV